MVLKGRKPLAKQYKKQYTSRTFYYPTDVKYLKVWEWFEHEYIGVLTTMDKNINRANFFRLLFFKFINQSLLKYKRDNPEKFDELFSHIIEDLKGVCEKENISFPKELDGNIDSND